MDTFLNNTKKIIFHRQKDILSSALILSLMTLLSSIFGFVRLHTLASFYTKEQLGLFFAAFRIPDFVFEILITGALSSAFIPLFVKYKQDDLKLSENISSIINFVLVAMIFFVIIIIFSTPLLTPIVTPGFDREKTMLVISFTQILLVCQLPLLVIGNILSGISQASKIFVITAIAPVVYNLGIIFGTIFLSSSLGIYAPVVGVIIGSILFLATQIPIVFFVSFKYQIRAFRKSALHEFVHLFTPRMLSVLTTQIDLFVDLALASLFGPAGVTIFVFAQRLQFFPVSFFGMSFGQASLPYLSDLYKENKLEEIRKIFINSILQLLFLSIPVSFFFIFARTPIVRFFVGGQKFDWEGTVKTARVLSYFAVSIPFHTLFYFVTRAFYATHNTKIPFFVNFSSSIINTVLSILLIVYLKLPVWYLGMSFSITMILNISVLLFLFRREIGGFELKKLLLNTSKIYFIAAISAAVSFPAMKLIDGLILDTSRTINLFLLLIIIGTTYTGVYLFLSWLFTIEEIYLLGNLLIKIRDIKRILVEMWTSD
ncbi:murein biosynthesis integral membrane protein MurJ [Candidatus Roizmanbacteria bacterium RIFCSPHIGHO2_02_FULL_40_13b]|uniref:Lipid II flippase n=1 Tax=Candidatus Roizmanbacteria bacterium RIFCSPHIGHO2_01_FULL_39_24 TaxID=1802032 RepID=A0A1F7GLF4_9BACT|nr:MAG: murein biosynthesis integral membrane protein MurJ [Candidatus Roizmanbacteria bacterium RIFCSPHIGHO2_01_FULL_39_24]OGK26985.1 MAG: murein biosynthesis integral membrane protein MurJ [Candidatus Roizmanbacteria bacterium RIFCSPHIGHO2_02_FULL_40_13b]OGK48860.1 MAG: murein biosynthesis integral membrane protein MurJ [Candidatus Roizmanbacteria bacterium RIFCSPLOWO2_01_FULL_40_32]